MKNLFEPSSPLDTILHALDEIIPEPKKRKIILTQIKDQDTSDRAFANLVDKF